MSAAPHIPVLLDEVVAALAPAPGAVIVDATFGAGGYTRRLLDAGATVHAFDRDPDAITGGCGWSEAGESPPRLVLHPRRFSEMVDSLAEAGVSHVDGVVMDIGVSSMQLDQADRGFAFSSDGPLDMRMGQEGESAADFLNTADESTIADVLYEYGEERQSRRVARAIVAARPLSTTGQLAQVVRKALGYRPGAPKDPATRSGAVANASRHLPASAPAFAPTFRDVAKATRPSAQELERNPRARSATLRCAVRTDAPPHERKAA